MARRGFKVFSSDEKKVVRKGFPVFLNEVTRIMEEGNLVFNEEKRMSPLGLDRINEHLEGFFDFKYSAQEAIDGLRGLVISRV
jgi:hypothetical protein